ncbi:hypothetical protein Esti_002846 [Eimeria stiedai]
MLQSPETLPSSESFPPHQEEVKANHRSLTGGLLSAVPRPRAVFPRSRARRLRTNAALAAFLTALAAAGLLVVCYRASFPRSAQGASGRSLASQWPDDDDEVDAEQSFILDACLNLQSEIAYEAPGGCASQQSRQEAIASIVARIEEEASQFGRGLHEPFPQGSAPEASMGQPVPYDPYEQWGFWGAGPSVQEGVAFPQQQAALPASVADPQGVMARLPGPEWSHPPVLRGPSTSVFTSGPWSSIVSGIGGKEAQQLSSSFSFQQTVPEAHVTSQSSASQEMPGSFSSQAQTFPPEPLLQTAPFSAEELLSWQQITFSSSTSDSSTQASEDLDEDLPLSPKSEGERKASEKCKRSKGTSSAFMMSSKRARRQVTASEEDEPVQQGSVSTHLPSPQQRSLLERPDLRNLKSLFSSPGHLKVEGGYMIVTAAGGTIYAIPHPPEQASAGAHPHYNIPKLLPGSLSRGFALSLVVKYLLFRHGSPLPVVNPSQTADKLAMRYMCLDALVSLLQLLGPALAPHLWWDTFVRWIPTDYQPRSSGSQVRRTIEYRELCSRLSNALNKLKQGQRLPEEETVRLKRDILAAQGPGVFKHRKWDFWRHDDAEYQKENKEGKRADRSPRANI